MVLEILPFELETGIQHALRRREVVPPVDELSPVGEAPDSVDGIWRLEFLLQAFDERGLRVLSGRAVRRRLVIDLIADHRRMVFEVADDLPDDPLRMPPEVRVEEVLILARTVEAGTSNWRIRRRVRIAERRRRPVMRDDDVRMLSIEPGRDGIS